MENKYLGLTPPMGWNSWNTFTWQINEEELLTKQLQSAFTAAGYHALFGKTQGYYGPYIWRDTSASGMPQ